MRFTCWQACVGNVARVRTETFAPRCPRVACPISYVGEDYRPLLMFSASQTWSASPRATFVLFFSCMIVRAAVKRLTDDVENAHTFLHESSGAAQTRPCTEGEGVGIDWTTCLQLHTHAHVDAHAQALGSCTGVRFSRAHLGLGGGVAVSFLGVFY